MTLEKTISLIKACLAQMDTVYGRAIFDEWAVVAFRDRKVRILHYEGPRREELQQSLGTDLRDFSEALIDGEHDVGDYDFARHARGTHYDAYVVLGEGCYLICNNTVKSMAGIAQDNRWLKAQVPFVALSDTVRSDPMSYVG